MGYFVVTRDCGIKVKIPQKLFDELLENNSTGLYYEVGFGMVLIIPHDEMMKIMKERIL